MASVLRELRDLAEALLITLREDVPTDSEHILSRTLEVDASEVVGHLAQALSAIGELVTDRSIDLTRVRASLRICESSLRSARSGYSSRFQSPTTWANLESLSQSRHEWSSWVTAVNNGIQACRQPFARADESIAKCWEEIAEQAASTVLPVSEGGAGPSLEYARRLFENVTDWYKNADNKAQILLGIDGAFLAFLTSSVFAKPEEVASLIKNFRLATWLLLGLMCLSLTGSIISAILCLRSRIYSTSDISQRWKDLSIDLDKSDTYTPEVMWFFQLVAALNKDRFRERLQVVDRLFETKVLASQIFALSRNVVRKHRWLNWGFTLAGLSLLLFMSSIASYLVRLR